MADAKSTAKHRGVTLSPEWPHVSVVWCDSCGAGWSPNLRSGGRLPRRWWACYSGCNVE